MTQQRLIRRAAAAGAVTALALGGVAMASPASAHGVKQQHAYLNSLNNSGTGGHFVVTVQGTRLNVSGTVHRAAPNLVHAQHIHFGAQARHECPTNRDDKKRDFRLTTLEGAPAYGPVAVSLTTKGDTSPRSVLAVDRYLKAQRNGMYRYERHNVMIHTTAQQNASAVAKAIRQGQGVVVVHGVDFNANGKYDVQGAGKSDLNPALPEEATAPAACGVLR